MSTLPDVATLDEAADYLRLTAEQLSRLALAGKIGHIKIGRKRTFPREAVETFIETNTVVAAAANPHGLTAGSLARVRKERA